MKRTVLILTAMLLCVMQVAAQTGGTVTDILKKASGLLMELATVVLHEAEIIDDFTQYAPMAATYGLNLCGIKRKHGYGDLTIILGTAYAIILPETYIMPIKPKSGKRVILYDGGGFICPCPLIPDEYLIKLLYRHDKTIKKPFHRIAAACLRGYADLRARPARAKLLL